MAKKAVKSLAGADNAPEDTGGPYIGYAGAEFSEEEISHPQAFGRSFVPTNVDLTKWIDQLETRGFNYCEGAGFNPGQGGGRVKHANDYDYIHGLQKWNHAPNAPPHMRASVLMRDKATKKLWMVDYQNSIDYDQWMQTVVDLCNGWGFLPGGEE